MPFDPAPEIASAEDVHGLIESKTPETDTLEFKERIESKSTAKALTALSNGRGGRIVYGIVEGNSRAVGLKLLDLSDAAEKVASIARDLVDEPLVLSRVTPIYLDEDKGVLIVTVDQSTRAPHFVQAQCFIRSGPTSRPATAREIGQMFAARKGAFIEEFGMSASAPADVVARIQKDRHLSGTRERTDYYLVLNNRGGVDCENVKYRFLMADGAEPNFPRVLEQGPITYLRAGTEISVPLSVAMGGTYASEVEVSWEVAGKTEVRRQSITL